MNEKPYIEHMLKRQLGMNPKRATQLNDSFATADDLHWICPKCKTKRVGTLQQLQSGCLQCLI